MQTCSLLCPILKYEKPFRIHFLAFSILTVTFSIASEGPTVSGKENINAALRYTKKNINELPKNLTEKDFWELAGLAGEGFFNYEPPFTAEQTQSIEEIKTYYRENIITLDGHARAVSNKIREQQRNLPQIATGQSKRVNALNFPSAPSE